MRPRTLSRPTPAAAVAPLGRRDFIRGAIGLGAATMIASCGTPPSFVSAPSPRVRRIGFLGSDTPGTGVEGLRRAMRELGYEEGRDIVIEFRFAESVPDRLPALADELVAIPVDVLFTIGGLLPTRAAKQATTTIPIVFTYLEDPVGQGIVPDLVRPGGNVTGMIAAPSQRAAKRLELLKEIVPSLSRVVLFGNQDQPGFSVRLRELLEAAQILGVASVVPVGIRTLDELESALSTIHRERAEAVMPVQTFRFFSGRPGAVARFMDFVVEQRLPQIYEDLLYVNAGGLLALATNDTARWRIVARLIDTILRGAKPGDLPVEFNSVYDIALSLPAAQRIGVTIPESIRRQATEVIR